MVRDEETQKMVEKCKEMGNKPEVVTTCKIVLETMEKKKSELPEEIKADQSYMEMAQNIKPEDVPKVLEMAMKLAKSGEIKDPELKNAVERLIRAIG